MQVASGQTPQAAAPLKGLPSGMAHRRIKRNLAYHIGRVTLGQWTRSTYGARSHMAKEKIFTRGPRMRSGGQTGVDRAALDAAVFTGRPYEGWCPKGGWAEDCLHPPGLLTNIPTLWKRQASLPNNEASGMYATVPSRSYLCRTQNIAPEVLILQWNAPGNMKSLAGSFITCMMTPSSALKMCYPDWEKNNR